MNFKIQPVLHAHEYQHVSTQYTRTESQIFKMSGRFRWLINNW